MLGVDLYLVVLLYGWDVAVTLVPCTVGPFQFVSSAF